MITELRQKSQVTIPKELVDRLGLLQGDKLDIFEKDGMIHIMPVVVYPKSHLEEIRQEVAAIKQRIADGSQPVFEDIDQLLGEL